MATRNRPESIIVCNRCRELHLKCDKELPICRRCADAGKACRRVYKFQNARTPRTQSRHWVNLPSRLTFVQEKPVLAGDGNYEWFEDLSAAEGNTELPVESETPGSLAVRQREQDEILPLRPYLEEPIWPLTNECEARLLRHYVENLAIWLDLCDQARHFEILVPQRAGVCPILLNAIFALASRHLSQTSDYDPLASNRYHEQCLRYLIPLLNTTTTMSDENLFAATIILRVLEEMDVQTIGQDTHGHLLGIHAFVNAGDRYMTPQSLGAACFWIGLRQEIYSAVINHQPVRMNIQRNIVDRSTEQASDEMWANRAVVYCADVINYCFGESNDSQQRWKALDEFGKLWEESLPISFAPIYTNPGDDANTFPRLWYHRSCHVIGLQHFLLGKMLLAASDPSLPRLGPTRKRALEQRDVLVMRLLRRLCGIGLSNQWTPPAMFTACMGIAMAGDLSHDRTEQEALMAILETTEREHARPTAAVQEQMREAWGWT